MPMARPYRVCVPRRHAVVRAAIEPGLVQGLQVVTGVVNGKVALGMISGAVLGGVGLIPIQGPVALRMTSGALLLGASAGVVGVGQGVSLAAGLPPTLAASVGLAGALGVYALIELAYRQRH